MKRYYSLCIKVRIIIPNLPIKKITIPKADDKALILKPAANTCGEIPADCEITSNPVINPIAWLKTPQTNANKLIEDINLIFFVKVCFLRKPITIKTITKISNINKGYIKKGPPSFKIDKYIIFIFKVIQSKVI